MNDMVKLVEYQEAPSIKVGNFLLSKGFDIADIYGRAYPYLTQRKGLGILHKEPEMKHRKYLFDIIMRKSRRIFLGVVWFDYGALGDREQNWVFEMYGRKYVELVRQLAEEMTSTFKVKIAIRLVQEQPELETCSYD